MRGARAALNFATCLLVLGSAPGDRRRRGWRARAQMRLICPNCAAQYEIDAAMIPAGGRDVQCSACGHTWFQRPESAEDDLADELGATERADRSYEDDIEDDPEDEAGATEPRRRELDAGTRAILREEAEREAAVRRAEREALETQPDLGLDLGQEDRGAAAKRRMAKLRGEPDPPPDPRAAAASRGDLLPDIEEINSTLTATSGRDAGGTPETAEAHDRRVGRRGFRLGFSVVLFLVAGAVLVYAYAAQIAAAVPRLQPALVVYVEQVNALRNEVDALMRRASERLGAEEGGTG
ncbi:hypothetical protein DXV76_04045 [Rhodobacteraceae bacterium CCMM004]|nr:hypothetical protein DXV76_04045 [Rhodobacteraceae bacterium CCMM004]